MRNFRDDSTNTAIPAVIACVITANYCEFIMRRLNSNVQPSNCGHRATWIEVSNSAPQSSHAQRSSIRPARLKRDFSATSNGLPQSGQFGRCRRFSSGWMGFGRARRGGSIIISVPLHDIPHRTLALSQRRMSRWHDRDENMKVLGMKVLWLWHDPKKWIPVFRKDHAQRSQSETISLWRGRSAEHQRSADSA